MVEAARSAARRPLTRVGHGFGHYRQLCQLLWFNVLPRSFAHVPVLAIDFALALALALDFAVAHVSRSFLSSLLRFSSSICFFPTVLSGPLLIRFIVSTSRY